MAAVSPSIPWPSSSRCCSAGGSGVCWAPCSPCPCWRRSRFSVTISIASPRWENSWAAKATRRGSVDAPKLHPAVLGPPLLGRVGRDWLRLTVPNRGELLRRDAVLGQIGADRSSPGQREALIVSRRADVVGVPANFDAGYNQ